MELNVTLRSVSLFKIEILSRVGNEGFKDQYGG